MANAAMGPHVVLTPEEVKFLEDTLERVPLSLTTPALHESILAKCRRARESHPSFATPTI